jgi:hypothetical protein
MNSKTVRIVWLTAMLALAMPLGGHGAQIEGVRFDPYHEEGNVRIPLQGTALFRYMGLFKAYAGAIYHEENLNLEEILSDRPKRLEVEYFHAIKGSDFGPVTDKFIARNLDAAALERIRPQVTYHNTLYRDVRPGDRYALTYIPGRGTELSLNGERLGVVPGAAFASALFAMWLGEKPMDAEFKRQLLGTP